MAQVTLFFGARVRVSFVKRDSCENALVHPLHKGSRREEDDMSQRKPRKLFDGVILFSIIYLLIGACLCGTTLQTKQPLPPTAERVADNVHTMQVALRN